MSGRGDDRNEASCGTYNPDRLSMLKEEFFGGRPKPQRGSVLQEGITTINGERQDVYGSPESSFSLIAKYWRTYLQHKKNLEITSSDVAMMMTLFKIARIANGSAHRDSYVDAAGYIGLAADMCCEVKDV